MKPLDLLLGCSDLPVDCPTILKIFILCIFDVDYTGTCLKRSAIRAFCTSSRNALVNTKSIRMHRLHRATGLVTEVECAFVCPLRSAFDASVKTERLALWVN